MLSPLKSYYRLLYKLLKKMPSIELDIEFLNNFICLIDVEDMYNHAVEDVACKLKDRQTTYILETKSEPLAGEYQPIFIRGTELDIYEVASETAQESSTKGLSASYFCSKAEELTSFTSVEEVWCNSRI